MKHSLPRLAVVLFLALAVTALMAPSSVAQIPNGELRGVVTDAQTGQPLPGANVMLRGTGYGAATNLNGEYVIRALPPAKYTVMARFIGYQSINQDVTVSAGQISKADFQLSATAIQIDEVVVTGTAVAAERRTVGNTIATISTREIGQVPVASLAEVLQGRTPGVVTLMSSGQAGGGASLRIRGMTSMTQSNEPVIYIDGVRVDNSNAEGFFTTGGQRPSRLNDISPGDIERVEIIKGASATTLYGTQASAGVIQIFTKRGSAGTPQVSLQHQRGWTVMPKMDIGQTVVTQYLLDSLARKGLNLKDFSNLTMGSDAINSLRVTGPLEAYEASVRGGVESARYYVSGRYEDELGAVPTNQVRRWNFKGNVDADVTNNFKLAFTSSYVNYMLRRPNNDNNIFGYVGNAFLANLFNVRPGYVWGETFTPITSAVKIITDQYVDRFTGSFTAEYRPLELWTNRLTVGTDVVAEENTQFFPYGEPYPLYPSGYKINSRRTNTRLTLDFASSYRTEFMTDFSASLTAGAQLFFDSEFNAVATGQNFPAPGVSTVSAAAVRLGYETRVLSRNGGLFAQGQLGWKNRLFLTLGSRFDRSSTFGKQFGTQFYPKAALSYIISEEPFWMVPFWNSLKLRTAWGKSGLQPAIYAAERTWAAVSALNAVPAVTPNNLGDVDLKPEISQEWEFGFDAAFFESRIGLEVTYYSQQTNDALVNVPSIPSLGFLNAQLRNVGKVKNQGYEVALRTYPYRSDDIEATFNVTLSGVKNEVVEMGKVPEIAFGLSSIGKIKKGYAISSFFGQRVVGAVTYDTYSAATRYGLPIVDSTRNATTGKMEGAVEFFGQSMPKLTGSVSAGVTLFRSLSIGATADWATGHVMFNGTRQFMVQASYNSYEPMRVLRAKLNDPSFVGEQRRQAQREYQMLNSAYPLMFIEKADFLKIREITVTYTLPAEWVNSFRLRTMSLTFAARNIATFTNYTGADPEVNFAGQQEINRGQDFLTMPQTRRFVLTLNLGL